LAPKPNPCNLQSNQPNHYRQPQSYPSPGYQIPSTSTPYQQSVENGYKYPVTDSGYRVPGYQIPSTSNQYQQSVESGYSVPISEYQLTGYQTPSASTHYQPQPSVESGYSVPEQGYSVSKQTYTPAYETHQNHFSQTVPHKASVDPPRETIEIVNTDYTSNEYTYSPNSAIQPRHLGQDDLFKPVQSQKQRHPKAFTPIRNTFTQTAPHKAQPNSPDTLKKETRKAKQIIHQSAFQQTRAHTPEPNKPNTSSRQGKTISNDDLFKPVQTQEQIRQPKAFSPIKNSFSQTAPHKAQPDSPFTLKQESREAKQVIHQSAFKQTRAHTPEPNKPNTSGRQGKAISSEVKFSAIKDRQLKFQPLPEKNEQLSVNTNLQHGLEQTPTPASFLGALRPISDSEFAPSPVTVDSSFEPSQSIIIARKPKLFGEGRIRFETKV